MGPLNYRQRLFVEHYLGESSGSAIDAVRRAGYRCPQTHGPRLLTTRGVRAAIDARVETAAIGANEVLARIADVATSDLLIFIEVDNDGGWKVNLKLVKRLGLGHLIKRLRTNKDGTSEIELEPRLPALLKLGEHYNLWKDEAQSQLTLVELAKGLKEQYDQLCRVKNEMISLLKRCRDRPEQFNRLFLKRPAYWSRQIDLCRSVVEYRTTVAYSGNMVGKDYWIAGIILWWLLTRPDSLCIITGPSQMVLGSVTFKEIRRCLDGALIPFGGKLSSSIKASPAVIEVAPGWHALGFSPTSVERSSGQHAKHLLTVVEEASGVEDFVFDAIDSLGYEEIRCRFIVLARKDEPTPDYACLSDIV